MDKELVKAAYIGALTIQKQAAHNDNVQALIDSGIIRPGDIEDRGWYNPTRWWDGIKDTWNKGTEALGAYVAPFTTGMTPQQYRETLQMSNKNRQYAVQQSMANRLQRAANQSRDEAKALDYRPNTAAGINSPSRQQELRQAGYVKQNQPPQPQPQQPTQQPAWATAAGMKSWRNKFDAADDAGRQAMLRRLDERQQGMTGADATRFGRVADQMRSYAQRATGGRTRGPTVTRGGPSGHVSMYYDPNAPVKPQNGTSQNGGSYYNGNNYRFAGGMTIKRPPIPYNPRWH